MKQTLIILGLLLLCAGSVFAAPQPAIIFTQDVVAVDAVGNLLPSTRIEPGDMPGMRSYDFDLGRRRLLRVETNAGDAEQRGLHQLAETVRRCYDHVEAVTGRPLARGVLLYLIELDELPVSYSFRADYDDASLWGEVRLALIAKGAPFTGPQAPANLSDLLYDTLPHELGHDVLETLPALAHDISGQPSRHTRWFIEGVCEMLAKGFSLRENPALHKQYLDLRRLDEVIGEPRIQEALFSWAQQNDNGLGRESDLYGAAMLTMMAWTENTPLAAVIGRLQAQARPLDGRDLLAMMKELTGQGAEETMALAQARGVVHKTAHLAARDG